MKKYDKVLQEKLSKEIDEKFAQFSAKIMRTNRKLIGVKIPTLRRIAKEFVGYDDFLENITINTFEDVAVACFYIGLTSKDCVALKKGIDFILPYIDNWGNCDTFVSSIKLLKTKAKFDFLQTIYDYLNSNEEFVVRFAIVVLLDYYLINEELSLEILEKVCKKQGKTYYIDMAIAWLVSVAFVKFKDCTLRLLQSGILSKDVQNKSISKICDSYRVAKEDKTLVKSLRM